MVAARGIRTLAFAAGSVGGLSGALYGLLNAQSVRARTIIGVATQLPHNADGLYRPDGSGPGTPAPGVRRSADQQTLTFAMIGDSLAAGLGAESGDRLPGVRLARGLAAASARPVRLVTHAMSGSRTSDLAAQVDAALVEPPDLAMVIIGGNDVTGRIGIAWAAAELSRQVSRLIAAGTTVVVGTCPDLGIVQPIPQPLRAIAQRWSLTLARAQRREMLRIGVPSVPVADLLSPEFFARPHELFSADRFHPNGVGYELAAGHLLGPLCAAAGFGPTPEPRAPAALTLGGAAPLPTAVPASGRRTMIPTALPVPAGNEPPAAA